MLQSLYVDLISNPFAPKPYRELAKYYEKIGQQDNADVFWHALSVKFENINEPDSTNPDQEQCVNIERLLDIP